MVEAAIISATSLNVSATFPAIPVQPTGRRAAKSPFLRAMSAASTLSASTNSGGTSLISRLAPPLLFVPGDPLGAERDRDGLGLCVTGAGPLEETGAGCIFGRAGSAERAETDS